MHTSTIVKTIYIYKKRVRINRTCINGQFNESINNLLEKIKFITLANITV